MRQRLRFSSSTALLLGRLALVAIAAAASVSGFVIWHRDASATARRASSPARYACPMHPEVVSSSPGDCPICRMALVAKALAGSSQTERLPGEAPGAHDDTPATLALPPGVQLRGYDTRSRAQRFDSAFEMRVPAAADGARTGVALFHLDESELIRPGEEGWFSPSSGPRGGAPVGLKVHVLSLPFERWDASTVLVHFEAEAGAELVANETGLLKLATRLRHGLVAPESAIIDSPEGPYVLIAEADRRRVTKRPVELGTRLYGYAAVVSGLRQGEYVVAKHAFVLDVERRGDRGERGGAP